MGTLDTFPRHSHNVLCTLRTVPAPRQLACHGWKGALRSLSVAFMVI